MMSLVCLSCIIVFCIGVGEILSWWVSVLMDRCVFGFMLLLSSILRIRLYIWLCRLCCFILVICCGIGVVIVFFLC